MANPSEFKSSTDTRLETPNPFPVEDGAVSCVGHAGEYSDESLAKKLASMDEDYHQLRQLLEKMNHLVMRFFVVATASK